MLRQIQPFKIYSTNLNYRLGWRNSSTASKCLNFQKSLWEHDPFYLPKIKVWLWQKKWVYTATFVPLETMNNKRAENFQSPKWNAQLFNKGQQRRPAFYRLKSNNKKFPTTSQAHRTTSIGYKYPVQICKLQNE